MNAGFLEVVLKAPSLLILAIAYVFAGTVWTIAKHGTPDEPDGRAS